MGSNTYEIVLTRAVPTLNGAGRATGSVALPAVTVQIKLYLTLTAHPTQPAEGDVNVSPLTRLRCPPAVKYLVRK